MSLMKQFGTSEDLETSGVWLDYGDFGVKILPANSRNKHFVKFSEKALKPVQKQIAAGTLSASRQAQLNREIFANTIIIDWRSEIDVEGEEEPQEQQGISWDRKEIMEFNIANVKETLKKFPHLLEDLMGQAVAVSTFQEDDDEAAAGNS